MIGIAIENATISFNVPSQTVTTNPITGLPETGTSTVTESFRVSIEKDTVEPVVNPIAGKDATKHFYSGRFNGLNLPYWYQPGGEYDITLDSGFKGTWYAYGTNVGRLGLQSIFGISIEGAIIY